MVLPVASPETAGALGRLAATIAKADDGMVVPVSIVGLDATDEQVEAATVAIQTAEAGAAAVGADARGRVIRHRSVVEAVLEAIEDDAATLALMGWQGHSPHHNIFGRMIDSIVGRSIVPLAIVRPGTSFADRVVLTMSHDHLLPAGGRGVTLAGDIAERLQAAAGAEVLLLRTGDRTHELPPEIRRLSGSVHHDRRPVDVAVADLAGERDLVLTPVAPTVEGLRSATVHMARALPASWLLVAIDVGPPPETKMAPAVAGAGMIVPAGPDLDEDVLHHVLVTVRPGGDEPVAWHDIEKALRLVGEVLLQERWTEEDRECLSVQVAIIAPSAGTAVSAAMMALDQARERMGPSEISYAVQD